MKLQFTRSGAIKRTIHLATPALMWANPVSPDQETWCGGKTGWGTCAKVRGTVETCKACKAAERASWKRAEKAAR